MIQLCPSIKQSFSFLKIWGQGFSDIKQFKVFCVPCNFMTGAVLWYLGSYIKVRKTMFSRCQDSLMEALTSGCPGILGASRKFSTEDIPHTVLRICCSRCRIRLKMQVKHRLKNTGLGARLMARVETHGLHEKLNTGGITGMGVRSDPHPQMKPRILQLGICLQHKITGSPPQLRRRRKREAEKSFTFQRLNCSHRPKRRDQLHENFILMTILVEFYHC